MDGLEEQIKRELNASFQQITNTRLIATTVDARTDKFPSVIEWFVTEPGLYALYKWTLHLFSVLSLLWHGWSI